MKIKNIISDFSESIKVRSNQYSICVLIIFALNGIFLMFTSHINVDENFYSYGAKLVWEGFIPYVDFFFTQSPVLLYVYGLPLLIFGNNLLNSRIITFVLLLFTAFFIIKIGKNIKFEMAGIYTVLAMSIAWWILYNLVITKTYTLTLLFIVIGLYIYSTDMKESWKYTISIVFMGLAGGVRLNIAALPIFLSCWIAIKEWDKESKMDLIKNLIKYLIISAITLIFIYGPIFLIDLLESGSLNRSLYNLIGVHTNRNLTLNVGLGIFGRILLIFDTLLQYLVISILIIFLPIFLFFALVIKKDIKTILSNYEVIFLIFFTQLVVIGVYMMLATLFAEYITSILPITIFVVFIGLIKFFRHIRFHHPDLKPFQKNYQKFIFLGLICLMPLTQLPQINQFVIPRTGRPFPERILINDLRQYETVSDFISIVSPPWGYIVTYECALTTQSGRNLMPGYEMSYFSYHHWFEPFGLLWPICQFYHVINGEILYYHLKSNYTTTAIFTLGQAFFTFLNERFDNEFFFGNNITEVLNSDYNLIAIYPGFGQVSDILFIYLRENITNWINLPGLPIDPFDF